MTHAQRPTPDPLAPSVVVEPGAHAAPGNGGTVRVHARNLSPYPLPITVELLGLDTNWAPGPAQTTSVPADATVTLEVPVYPTAGAVPGTYPFVARVSAGDATTTVESQLRVDAPSTVMLSIEPADSQSTFGRHVVVVLNNSGDQDVPLRLAVRSDKGLHVTLDDRNPRVPAHTTVRIPARVSVRRPQLFGHRNRMSYSIVARGDHAPARFRAVHTAKPLLGSTGLRVLSMALVAALWITGVVVTLPWLTSHVTPDHAVATSPVDTGDSSPAPTNGSPGTDEPDHTPAAAASSTGERTEVRIGGVVTTGDDDRDGVRVQVRPASVLDATDHDTPDLGTPPGAFTTRGVALTSTRQDRDVSLGKIPAHALTITRSTPVAAQRATTTGPDGTWAIAGMAPDTNYLITLSKPGYQTQRYVMTGAQAASSPLKVALTAGTGHISGAVTGPNGPVGNATITITDGTTTATTSTSTTQNVGAWSIEGLSTPSTYLVTVTADGLGSQATLVHLTPAQHTQVDLHLHAGVATLTGNVTGPDTLGNVTGLGGIVVTASNGTTTRTASTTTGDGAGTFLLTDLPLPATYTVTFSGQGYRTQSHEVTLTAGNTTADLDVLLDESHGVVQGTITGPDGTGLTGAGLVLSNAENTYKTMSTSDGDGTFRLNGVTPGDYVLTGQMFGHINAYAPVTVAPSGTSDIHLILTAIPGDGLTATSHIRGRVSDARTNGQIVCPDKAPTDPCEVTVTLTTQGKDGTARTVSVTANADREYTIPATTDEGLLPGLHTLQITADGYAPGQVTAQVPMGAVVRANQVALHPAPAIVGTVTARSGVVPAGTCVVAVSGNTDPLSGGGCTVTGDPAAPECQTTGDLVCTVVNVDGSYKLEHLRSGTYQVAVVPPAGGQYLPVAGVEMSVSPGDVRRYDATIDRLGRVLLTVLTDTGTASLLPADEAHVTPVRVDGTDSTALAPVVTDPDGLVLVDSLTPGTYRFDVTWTLTSTAPAVPLTGTSATVTVGNNQELSQQVVLTRDASGFRSQVVTDLGAHGTVTAGGVDVQVHGVIGYNGLIPVYGSATATTDEAGHFTVVTDPNETGPHHAYLPVVGDTVDLQVRDSQFVPFTQNKMSIAALDGSSVVLEPIGKAFSGELVLTGEDTAPRPLDPAEVELRVELAPPGADRATVTVGAGGALVWNDPSQPTSDTGPGTWIRPGTYRVVATADGYASTPVTFTVPLAGMTGPVQVELNRFGELRVRVLTGNGSETRAVPDAVVTLTRPGMGEQTLTPVPGANTVNFGEVPAGTYQVLVQAAGYAFDTFPVTVEPGGTSPNDVFLTPMGTIYGKVEVLSTTGTRKAMSNVLVHAKYNSQTFTAVTDATGQYRITGTVTDEGLESGTWEVTTTVDGYSTWYAEPPGMLGAKFFPVEVDASAGALQNITLVPDPVDLVVDLYDPQNPDATDALSHMQVALHTPTGPVSPTCTPLSASSELCPTVPDAEGNPTAQVPGRYTFVDLEPGTYTLDVTGGGYAPLMVNVSAAPAERTQVNIPLASRTNTITGTVSGQAGADVAAPVVDAQVVLSSTGGDEVASSQTVAGGAFTFADVPDGTYVLEVSHAGYSPVTRSVHVQGGQVASLDIVLFVAARQVTVTLLSGQGFPLTGALVTLTDEGGQPIVAAQPAVPDGAGKYLVTFNQVPPGAWVVRAVGPAGHCGTYTAPLAAEAHDVTVSVNEMRVRVSVTSEGTSPVPSVGATVTSGGETAAEVLVGVGGGEQVLYLPRAAEYTVSPAGVPGWSYTPEFTVVSAGTVDARVTFTLVKDPVATSVEFTSPSAVDVVTGDLLTVVAGVSPADGMLDGARVDLLRDGVVIASTTVVGSGATFTGVDTTGWAEGEHVLTAELAAGAGYLASTTTGPVVVTVQDPEPEPPADSEG